MPSGYSRTVNFAVVGIQSDDGLEEALGYLALYPPRTAQDAKLFRTRTYDATIVITGSNFNAVTYVGKFAFEGSDYTGTGVVTRYPHWTEGPSKTSRGR